jgi:hypothetical protein
MRPTARRGRHHPPALARLRRGARVEHLLVAGDTHGWPAITDANQPVVRFLRGW